MAATSPSFPVVREAVASFPDREHFHHAVAKLLAAGFDTSDLSVLASHDSLAAAGEAVGEPRRRPGRARRRDQIHHAVDRRRDHPVSGGPIAAIVAALVGAGLGGAALKELFDDYTAPGTTKIRRGAQGRRGAPLGALRGSHRELTATRILEEAGGRHVHIHGRPAGQTSGEG